MIPPDSRVLLIRIRSMGDCVLTTPAIRILKDARPDVKIAVVVEPAFAAVFEGNSAIDAILPPSLTEVRAWKPDIALNLHGGTRSQILMLSSGARVRAGFGHHRHAAYHVRIPRAQEILGEERPVHTAEHLASAMFYFGVPAGVEIPRAELYAETQTVPGGPARAVIHATAAMPYKVWQPERFVAVATHVREQLHLEPVFIGAAGDDLSPFAKFARMQGAPLSDVKTLIARARLFIGNDSGPAHIAAAFGLPVAVLYGRPEHEVTWAPWRAAHACTFSDPGGISAIPADRVTAALDAMMRRR